MKEWRAELTLMVITLIWGATFVFTQLGLAYTSPSVYLVIRFSLALIILLTFFGKHLRDIKKQTVIHGMILGAIFGGGFLLQTFGLKYTSVPKSSFITGVVVTIVPFVYWLIERKPINIWQLAGVVVATCGLYLFTKPDISNINPGDLVTLISTIFWAFYITYMDVFTRDKSGFKATTQLVIMQYFAATPMALASMFFFDIGNISVNWSNTLITSLAFNALLASVLVTFIHTGVQKFTNPVKAALIFSLEPVVATIIAVLYYGTPLKSNETIGGAILISGVMISEIFPMIFKKRV
jgi:drug/metabolite transporter (DMT)-like permease